MADGGGSGGVCLADDAGPRDQREASDWGVDQRQEQGVSLMGPAVRRSLGARPRADDLSGQRWLTMQAKP